MPGPSHKFQFQQNALYREYDDVLEPSDVENMVVSSGGQRNSLWKQQKKLCKRSRTLFEDPDFPADMSSCFRTRRPASDFLWKRPRVRRALSRVFHVFVINGLNLAENGPDYYSDKLFVTCQFHTERCERPPWLSTLYPNF